MRRAGAWGGETEILTLTHVLAAPIEVFMVDAGALRSIGMYGDEYGGGGGGGGGGEGGGGVAAEGDSGVAAEASGGGASGGSGIAVLFHGAGHYEALSICQPMSKL